MGGRQPGEVPTDPEAYQALLKRWGLDDESLGIGKARASREPASETPSPSPETDQPGETAPHDVDADEPIPAEPVETAEPFDASTAIEPDLNADPLADDAVAEDATVEDAAAAAFDDDHGAEEIGLGFLDNDQEPLAEVSHGERKRKRVWLRRSLLTLTAVFALILGTAGFYVVTGVQALQSLKRDPGLMPTDDGYQTAPPAVTGPLNFVLMGSDSRSANDPGRSDSLMVAHLNATRDKLYLITVPRDYYVDIPGHGKNKINAAYAYGGPALTVKTVQNLLNDRMDHTVMIDFDGFVGLTTDVGGVTVFNETDSTNLGFHYPRGPITISGEEALAYVRERYDLPGGDLDRAARQRAVVKAIILKLLRPEVIGNPATFNNVAKKLGGYVTIDAKLSNDLIWSIATSLDIRSAADIRQIQAPIAAFKRVPGAGEVDLVDTQKMGLLAQAVQGDELAAYWQQYGED